MSKGRYAAIFDKKPLDVEPETERVEKPKRKAKAKVESKAEPKAKSARKATPLPATTARGRERIPVVRWADVETLVTVGAKVPADVAQHWAIEAKRQRTSVSYIISLALIEAFGTPPDAILPDETGTPEEQKSKDL